jgi:hypothetical protein
MVAVVKGQGAGQPSGEAAEQPGESLESAWRRVGGRGLIGRLAGQISTPGRSEGAKQLARPSLLPITAAPPSSHLPQTAGGGPGLSVSCHCPLRKGGAAVMASLPCLSCPDRPSARVCSGKRIKWDCSCCCRGRGRGSRSPWPPARTGRLPSPESRWLLFLSHPSVHGLPPCHPATACPVPQTSKPPNPSPKSRLLQR